MARVILADRARKDLVEIGKYTVKRWGKEQARKYIEQIYRYADELANRRLPGKSREDVAANL